MRRLVIKTSQFDDKAMYRLTIDFGNIAEKAHEPISIKRLLDPYVHIEKRPEREELHYTHVELQDITPQFVKLTDAEYLKDVIVQTCPINFDPNFPYRKELEDWLERYGINCYRIFFKGVEVFRDFPKNIEPPQFKELTLGSDKKTVAVAWSCINKETGILKENGLERKNISLRIKNFAVGIRGIYSENNERGRRYGIEKIDSPSNLDWYAGEVHIIDKDIIPNTPRSELEETARSAQFIGILRDYYTKRTLKFQTSRSSGLSVRLHNQPDCRALYQFLPRIFQRIRVSSQKSGVN